MSVVIAGTTYPMQSFNETLVVAGVRARNYDNGLVSQERNEKRQWSGSTSFLTPAEYAALRTSTALGTVVSVTCTPLGVTISAMVSVSMGITQSVVLVVADLVISEV